MYAPLIAKSASSSSSESATRSGRPAGTPLHESSHLTETHEKHLHAPPSPLQDFSRIAVSTPGHPASVHRTSPMWPPIGRIQTKLALGRVDDPLERDADRVAEQVMRMPGPGRVPSVSLASTGVQRKCATCGDEEDEEHTVHAKPAASSSMLPAQQDSVPTGMITSALKRPGRPIDPADRSFFEPRFGRSLADIRVHTDPADARSATSIGARAYTLGRDIVFAPGEYKPGSHAGGWLLAHEITHVLQQSPGGVEAPQTIRRETGKMLQQGTPAPAAGLTASPPPAPKTNAPLTEQAGPTGSLTQPATPPAPPESGPVLRLIFSCNDMKMRLETNTTAAVYNLHKCSLPLGSYDPTVKIEGNFFHLKFDDPLTKEQNFSFSFARLKPGQQLPSVLMKDQATVHVDVVEHLPATSPTAPASSVKGGAPDATATPAEPTCVRLRDRELVPYKSAQRDLFKPINFKERSIWTQSIPLGEFGWVDASAKVSGGLKGTLDGHYGPGMLTDICLTHLISSTPSSSPIKHPLLDEKSHADVNTFAIGGRARFKFDAGAHVGIIANGKLKISGDFLSKFEVASIEGGLTARGDASLTGGLDAMVEIVARFTQSSATLRADKTARALSELTYFPLPLEVRISKSSLDKIDLAAKIALKGHAKLSFGLQATAALKLLGRFELWRDTWQLKNAVDLGLGWAGGISYSPNPGPHWILGAIGKLEGIDGLLNEQEEDDDANVEDDDVLAGLLNQANGHVTAPNGLSPNNALPFDWHKPIDLYPETLDIPNADDPKSVSRDKGPTNVRYTSRGRTVQERIGVARGNWMYQDKVFRYIPHADEPRQEQARMRNLLDTLGHQRGGTDVDHVYELQFGGADNFPNLWPLDNSANRSAGGRHNDQLDHYRTQLGNIAGRYFVVARVGV
ncbi:eCIS core domain-containing protein [Acidicapsa acidisoli]|uniref:eCIS core domain-containing protein n=1 Tax=Acidicapsa acidisoli TaxID=1615681 RepID=UPI0021DFB15F|nr:DUF4157 domain-containing protein [Acidicapsa acidisoli]